MENLTRKEIRYLCFRFLQEVDGGNPVIEEKDGIMSFAKEVKEHFEKEEDFDGWNHFGKTWDVSEKAPLVAVTRTRSLVSEWNKEVELTAKDFPIFTEKSEEEVVLPQKGFFKESKRKNRTKGN